MKTSLDCIACLVRQSLDSIRLQTSDEEVHERLLRQVLRWASEMDFRQSPPEMAQRVHREMRKLTGQSDPYWNIKDRFNRLAAELYPTLEQWVEDSDNPLETAVRLAMAGNVIDFGVNSHVSKEQVLEAVRHALSASIDGDLRTFSETVSAATDILYLADNAGEIVLDRLLIERLPREQVTVAVRGFPVINDATRVDAEQIGLTELVEVIDTGSDVPGVILDQCRDSFREHFDRAQLIIAKGQGNYETLSDVNRDIFFLLKAKCQVIARHIGCEVDALVLRRSAFQAAPHDGVRTSE
jgi:uncharacterized protein with ATP-grasp and redox domains